MLILVLGPILARSVSRAGRVHAIPVIPTCTVGEITMISQPTVPILYRLTVSATDPTESHFDVVALVETLHTYTVSGTPLIPEYRSKHMGPLNFTCCFKSVLYRHLLLIFLQFFGHYIFKLIFSITYHAIRNMAIIFSSM